MKNTGTCPKCASHDLLRVPGTIGHGGSGNNIQVGWWIYSGVMVTRLVCGNCGYSEEWIESPADIERLRKKFGGAG
ncbi:MAG TPA: hypothetical protein VN851_03510 [Thermoanaerobaculia bacterium]|nr:hypothetical protein [Thermoanaerobaculia bacterium]